MHNNNGSRFVFHCAIPFDTIVLVATKASWLYVYLLIWLMCYAVYNSHGVSVNLDSELDWTHGLDFGQ